MMRNGKRVGLALSGGGYRAAAFHLGTMRALYHLKVLDKVDVLSTISGGSITGAAYSLQNQPYPVFEQKIADTLREKSVIANVLCSWIFIRTALFILVFAAASVYVLFTRYPWLSPVLLILMVVLLLLFQYRIFPVSRQIERAYDRFFFDKMKLDQLGREPLITIGSTNIQTSRPFHFSHDGMGDSALTYGQPPVTFNHAGFPVSRAVMASSGVPFAFSPVLIEQKYFDNPSLADKWMPVLVDGGVYDNQGVHKLTEPGSRYQCDIVVVSDAGNNLPFEKSYNNVLVVLVRAMNVFMARIKHFQIVANVYRNTSSGTNREITYVSIAWDIERLIPGFMDNLAKNNITSGVLAHHNIPAQWLVNFKAHRQDIQSHLEQQCGYEEILKNKVNTSDLDCARSVGTNLTKLSARQIDCLIRHAANITELQIRLYCPTLLNP
jgi:NTE family protein